MGTQCTYISFFTLTLSFIFKKNNYKIYLSVTKQNHKRKITYKQNYVPKSQTYRRKTANEGSFSYKMYPNIVYENIQNVLSQKWFGTATKILCCKGFQYWKRWSMFKILITCNKV